MIVMKATVVVLLLLVLFFISLTTTTLVHSFTSIIVSTTLPSGQRRFLLPHKKTPLLSAHSLTTAFEWLAEERQGGGGRGAGGGKNEHHLLSSLAYSTIGWIDPAAEAAAAADKVDETLLNSVGSNASAVAAAAVAVIDVPIYPLGAVYLPTGSHVNYTLNNVEPRNLQMALDLLSSMQEEESKSTSTSSSSPSTMMLPPTMTTTCGGDGCFCAVLSASDSGRIATVGTLMKIVHADIQYHHESSSSSKGSSISSSSSRNGNSQGNGSIDGIARIRLTCQAQDIVKIHCIHNPHAFSKQNRILRSSEYLRGTVSILKSSFSSSSSSSIITETTSMQQQHQKNRQQQRRLAQDYNLIKTMYQLQIGAKDHGHGRRDGNNLSLLLFPPSFLYELGNAMPTWKEEEDRGVFNTTSNFWKAAQEWQSVCHSLLQGKQQLLSADVNELLIEAATTTGRGPLKLPIHVHEMPPSIQRQVQTMEVQAQTQYCQLGMDPILDFQALLGLAAAAATNANANTSPTPPTPLEWLSFMIARERQRLETLASSSSF